jgi:hypothetical protein
VDVVAGQPVRRGHQDNVKVGNRRMITQLVQPEPAKAGTAIAVVTVNVLLIQRPPTADSRRVQPGKLLLDSLRSGLSDGRHARIHRRAHQAPSPRDQRQSPQIALVGPANQQPVGPIPSALAVSARDGLTVNGPSPNHRALPGQHRPEEEIPATAAAGAIKSGSAAATARSRTCRLWFDHRRRIPGPTRTR